MITTTGIYDLPATQYHADPAPVASLSHSIAKKLIRQSPMHAHHAHPRLGASGATTPSRAMDDGTIIHSLLLGKGGDFEVIRADDFRTNAAKAARDAAWAAGKAPVLEHKLEVLKDIVAAARRQIEAHPGARDILGAGNAEQAMLWELDGTWFRSLVDFMPTTGGMIDVKTTGMSAAPGEWERRLITEYATQDAFYARGYRAIFGVQPPPMRFVVIETDAPYGVSVMQAAPSLREVAEAEIDRAIKIWRQCMSTGQWPGYPQFIASVEAPNWLLNRMDEQENRDAFLENVA